MKLGSLCPLSDDDLLARIRTLAAVGRRADAKLVFFLAELERRKLHLDAAYSSLQDFCVRALRMSEGEAFRRMTAARLTLRFPSIPDRIARGDVHLSGLVLLRSPHRRESRRAPRRGGREDEESHPRNAGEARSSSGRAFTHHDRRGASDVDRATRVRFSEC
jgi:hypothetical protein